MGTEKQLCVRDRDWLEALIAKDGTFVGTYIAGRLVRGGCRAIEVDDVIQGFWVKMCQNVGALRRVDESGGNIRAYLVRCARSAVWQEYNGFFGCTRWSVRDGRTVFLRGRLQRCGKPFSQVFASSGTVEGGQVVSGVSDLKVWACRDALLFVSF